ncbi:MAG TPA: PPOX class F420-dependent oxidoreductase [Ktedonobacterales bacterium]|nr:PPOX class F420-dependent oxidoreductase [Ktedonobacterales bacterium]
MAKMIKEESQAFLSYGTRTGKIATVRKDGAPHITPIWFVLDGDDLIFTTGDHSAKAMHVRRDPRVTICVDEEKPLYAFVIVEGTATLSDDLDAMLPWATQIAARYMGADRAEEYGRRNAVAGELLVRVTPTRIIAEKDVAG